MRVYLLRVERDGAFLLGELPDWPECSPVGLTLDDLIADAKREIDAAAIARGDVSAAAYEVRLAR